MKKKVVIILVIILIIILAIVAKYISTQKQVKTFEHIEIPKEDIEISEGIEEQLQQYRNIVILGKDSEVADYDSGRSDCIIIASINETTKEIKFVSVYRDTYLQIPGRSLDKVNHAYAYGGPALTMSTLNTNLDLNITEFVSINFAATKDVINQIGGVEITVTDAEANSISGISKGGTYNLNGDQALAYSRIRKIDTDYQRTERMRTVLSAVFEKAKTMGSYELIKLINIILPEISTNISEEEISSLSQQVSQYKISESIGWPYNTRGKTIDGIWYGPPITLKSNVIRLHKELFGEEDYEPSESVEEISKKIVNATGYTE